MENELLSIKNLTTEFISESQRFIAVSDLSLSLSAGETLGIVGESGSGKSVTSLSVMGLIPSPPGQITAGSIHFRDRNNQTSDLLSLTEQSMRKIRGNEIAMIFQEPMTSLNPVLTCGYQVAEALRLHKQMNRRDARQRTIELFSKVKLPRPESIYDSYPHQLSGGQKQRVMIAMAISCDPSVLIADEPTTALDVTVQSTILELLRDLQQEKNMGMMFITHDLGVIADIAHRVAVMYKGKIVEQGTVSEIFSNPKHPYTKGLIACRPPLNRKMKTLPTVNDFMRITDGGMEETGKSIESVMDSMTATTTDLQKRNTLLENQKNTLEVKSLCTWFPVKKGIFGRTTEFIKAVDEVSFNVKKGETLGLVGESGCGKTTLGRSILRLIEPTSGKVIFDDTDITSLGPQEMRAIRRKIQIIFQDPYSSLNPRMTVGAAIMEPMQVHNILVNDRHRKEKVISILERVNLTADHFNRYPHEFSGGQRQRICIARAIAMEPEFIVCDESVSALDVSVQAQVLNLLNELRDQLGLTYIFISHDLSVVKFMSDRMIIMNQGKIVESGLPDDIYSNPKSAYTQRLIASIPKGL